jgi:hypothetical protein
VRRFRLGLGVLVVLAMAPAMFADITDYMLNIGGTTYCASYGTFATCSSDGGFAAAAGAGAVSSFNESYNGSGLGTLTLTYDPGPGTYNVDLWLFEQLATPSFNEYGAVSGSTASGQSYQIDVPDYDYGGELGTAGAGSIIANTAASALANTNYIPGQDSSYAGGGFCATLPDPNCNDYTSMAMGFNFTLAASQQELLTFNVSTTQPTGGFYLEQIHPVDGSNTTETDYFFTASASPESIGPPPVPEPGSILLLATLAGILAWAFRPRSAVGNTK